MKSVLKTVGIITIFSILTRLLGFFFRIFLSRKLGAEGLGIYQIASSIIGVFMTLVASGLPLTTAKSVAKFHHEKNSLKKDVTTTSACVIAFVASIVSCVVLVLGKDALNFFVKNETATELILIMCPAIIFSSVYATFRGALWGQNSFFWVSFTEFLEQIVRILLILIFAYKMTDVYTSTKTVAWTFSLTCLISSVIVIIVYLIKGGKVRFKTGEYKNILKSASPITGVRIASSFLQPVTALLIPFLLCLVGFSSTDAISCYGVIMGMSFPLLFTPMTVIGSISMVLVPKISVLKANKDFDAISKSIDSSIGFSLFLGVLFIPLFLSCGDLIGIVLYDNLSAGIYLQLSAVCILPIILNNITSSLLNALDMEVKSFINYIIGTVVLLASLVSLTFIFKEYSIIISFFLSMSTIAFLNYRMILKTVPYQRSNILKTILKYLLIILPCSILGHMLSNVLYNFLPAFVAGFIGGGVSMISTVILIYVFNVYDFLTAIKLKFQKKYSS